MTVRIKIKLSSKIMLVLQAECGQVSRDPEAREGTG